LRRRPQPKRKWFPLKRNCFMRGRACQRAPCNVALYGHRRSRTGPGRPREQGIAAGGVACEGFYWLAVLVTFALGTAGTSAVFPAAILATVIRTTCACGSGGSGSTDRRSGKGLGRRRRPAAADGRYRLGLPRRQDRRSAQSGPGRHARSHRGKAGPRRPADRAAVTGSVKAGNTGPLCDRALRPDPA